MIIPTDILAEMILHARQDAPNEACGFLGGKGDQVRKCYRLTNLDASPEHFSLDPREQFGAVKDMRAEGIELLAVYHSHPATLARMSAEDLRLAYAPGIQYAIISLADPENPVVRSFRVVDGEPVEEPVIIQE